MSAPTVRGGETRKPPSADDAMSSEEKEALVEQLEAFEGPDRREKRGTEPETEGEPGVARS